MNPKISIITPSFNHAKYVGFFIESVLKQSFMDFELIIVDDCSQDNNVAEILKFQDCRIKLIQHEYNQGINASLNTAFKHSCGEYLIFCASDDMLESNALETIYNAFCQYPNIKAIYPSLIRIDENGKKDNKKFMDVKSKSREEYLHDFFMLGNYLTSPGMAMKRVDFEYILYPLNNAMCNQQDAQMHIKILLNGDIKILDEALVLYRFNPHTNNISTRTDSTTNRENMEIKMLMDAFLTIKDTELLKKIFKQEILALQIEPHKIAIDYFLGRMALYSCNEMRKIWGYHKIMESYNTKEKACILKDLYQFDFKAYLALTKYFDNKMLKKYRKYKKITKILGGINVILLCFICVIIIKAIA